MSRYPAASSHNLDVGASTTLRSCAIGRQIQRQLQWQICSYRVKVAKQ
jgi:hypothetical protein